MDDEVAISNLFQEASTTSIPTTNIAASWRKGNSYDPRECGVCNEEFDEDLKCPRTLRCSHNLCSSCINILISNNTKKCPFCRRNFRANAASDIMINQGILDFIRYLTPEEATTEEVMNTKAAPSKSKIKDYKEEIAKATDDLLMICLEERNQIESSVRDVRRLKENLKLENILINEEILPKIHNIAKRNFRTTEFLQLADKKLHSQLEEVNIKEKELSDMKLKLSSVKSFKEMGIVMDESENANTAIRAWTENSKARILENRRYVHSVEKDVQASKEQVQVLRDTLSYQDDDEEEESDSFPICVV